MRILGIETSCDETAVAVLEVKNGVFKVVKDVISSSSQLQAKYGGIVPEVAARKQVEYMIPVLEKVLGKKGKQIDYIALTNGPGLITSLRVGVEAGKTLSYAWEKPMVAVNHLEGHIYSAEMSNSRKLGKLKFPALALIVSGGHTQLVLLESYLKYKIIGETQDDAVGEAFDKVAKMMNLGYPGGPVISKLAKKGNASKVEMPRPMINSGDYNFSFSGIKTAVLYKMREGRIKNQDMCASFQEACVEVLVNKTIKAAQEFKVKTILLGGGVAANENLRDSLKKEVGSKLDKVKLLVPDMKMTGDNAAMIAAAGYYKIKNKKFSDWKKIKTNANLRLGE